MVALEKYEQVGARFLDIATEAGYPDPDEIHYRPGDEEIEFIWREQKVAVIVELDECADRVAGPPDDIPF